MNLENFQTNETAKRMLSMVSNGWYDKSYIGKWLFQVIGTEMEDARGIFVELWKQIFPETATWGLMYHEQKYGITPAAGESIEDRRQRILNYRDVRVPLNPERFSKIISDLTGADVELIERQKTYTFSVIFSGDIENPAAAYSQIRKMKPSHLSFSPGYRFDVNEENIVRLIRNRHRMHIDWWNGPVVLLDGTWALNGAYTLGGIYVHPAKVRNRLEVKTEMQNKAGILMKRNYWQLNGQFFLDGGKELNAEYVKEEL